MSGIEVAGLVLGAIPVVIWGLENYKVTREIWRRSRSKALLVDRLINALQEQRLLIELDLQILLRAAGFEDDEIAGLETSSCYGLLLDQRLAEPLIRYLGRVYEPYRGALDRCERIIVDIAQSIGSLASQTPSQKQAQGNYLSDLIKLHTNLTQDSRWRQTGQKFKFALKKEELDQKISELDASTSMLSRLRVAGGLIQDDDQLSSSSRRIQQLSSYLNKMQRYTSDLYSAIRESCSMSCHTMHRFKLYLEDQSAPLLRKRSQVSFRIEFLPVPTPAEIKAWHHAHVETLEEEHTRTKANPGHQSHSKELPMVAFSLPETGASPKYRVHDLCAVFTKESSSDMLLKLYLSQHGKLASCHLPIDPQSQDNRSNVLAETLTVEAIIRSAYDSKENPIRWSWNHRILLAYRLASCLLQFQSTPWLDGSWRKQSIFFPKSAVADRSGKDSWHFDADSPFIIHDFQSSPIPVLAGQTNAKASLLDLGILLLEIWHLTPFEAYADQEHLSLDNTYGARYEIASKWLNDTVDNILPFYSDPVCRCIEGTFACTAPMLQWTDRQFQSSVCESVIKPLWDNCSSKTR